MKKLLSMILVLILLPVIALADPDVASMTDQELTDLIAACSAELMARHTVEPDGILIFEYEGVKVYQTGDAAVLGDYLRIPVALNNENDYEVIIGINTPICNGWEIYASGCSAAANARKKGTLSFEVSEADVTEIDQIISLTFRWQVFDNNTWTTVYIQEEAEDHRFW